MQIGDASGEHIKETRLGGGAEDSVLGFFALHSLEALLQREEELAESLLLVALRCIESKEKEECFRE